MAGTRRHPNSLKNLKPIPKGQSGNPSGRPKGTITFVTRMRNAFNEAPPGQKLSLTDVLIKMAYNDEEPGRQQWAIQFIAAYGIGLPKRELDDESARKIAKEMFETAMAEAKRRRALQVELTGNAPDGS